MAEILREFASPRGVRRFSAGAWRIVISPMIPQDFPSCYYSSMRNLAVLVIHLIATLARLLGPGGVRSLVAESLLLKHQHLIVNRSRQRSPNLSAGDRILAGLLALLVRPTRLVVQVQNHYVPSSATVLRSRPYCWGGGSSFGFSASLAALFRRAASATLTSHVAVNCDSAVCT
jgi:hypothetical protein